MTPIPFKDLGRKDLLNCSKGQLYELKRTNPDFKRLIPVSYPAGRPVAYVEDARAYLAFMREKALRYGMPKAGRPRGSKNKAKADQPQAAE